MHQQEWNNSAQIMTDESSTPPSSFMPISEGVQKYTRDDIEGGDPSDTPNSRENNLFRTISEFTEDGVATGTAAEETYIREKLIATGKLPPPPPPKYPFFAPENSKMRKTLLIKYVKTMIAFWIFILTVWSIYWGSMYRRQTRYVNLNYLVAVESDPSGVISESLRLTTLESPLNELGTWVFQQGLSEETIQKMIYDQDYWAAIYVTDDNISQNLINAFQTGTNITNNEYIKVLYETARDPTTMGGVVASTLFRFQSDLLNIMQSYAYPSIMNNLTATQFSNLQNTNLLTSYPVLQYTDSKPVDPVTNGPLQVGLIFIIIITFFQIMWLGEIYGTAAKSVVTVQYILFQLILSHITFLVVSLAFTCLNAAFQIYMNDTWKGGFGVFWMVSYMLMAAVGGANNNVSLILFAVCPPLMGFWLLFFVVTNISATFAPIQLCPEIFRYTYAMPVKNAYELLKIVLFDVSKAHLGRYFGILAAWMVLNSVLLPFCIMFFATTMKKKIMKQQKAIIEKEMKEQSD